MKKTKKYKPIKEEPSRVEEPAVAFETKAREAFFAHELTNEDIVLKSIKGIEANHFDTIASTYNIPPQQLAHYLGISERTVRNYKDNDKSLYPQQGEQLLKIQKLMALGVEVFGSSKILKHWLHKPAYGLDYRAPVQLLITSEGINLVIDEIQRIAFGDFS